MSNAIEIRDLHYRAGKTFEIRDLALNVPTGSMYGFLGPNGAGKTTLMRLVLGLLKAKAGSITVLGREIPREIPAALLRTGYVPEQPHLYQTLTVSEAMRFHAAFYPTWDAKWAADLVGTFNLDRSRVLSRLSKGEMGKLEMLLALAQRPELLVLDEPTDGLDPVVRRDVLTALLDYVSQGNATVFISSHLVHELERICDWVGVMDRGRLVAEVPMQSFKNGIKRLRVANPPVLSAGTPFVLLSRDATETGQETWLVRGWQAPMTQWFNGAGAEIREVMDLDLEEGFVELLRTFRTRS